MCHAIECFTSNKSNPFADTFSLKAYDIIMNYVWVISGWVGLGVTVIMIIRVIYNRVKYGKNYGLQKAE